MHTTKKNAEDRAANKKADQMEAALAFDLREFIINIDPLEGIKTMTDLILTRQDDEPLSFHDQLNIKSIYELLFAMHGQRYRKY